MDAIRRKFAGLTDLAGHPDAAEMIARGLAFRAPDGRVFRTISGGDGTDEPSDADQVVARLTGEGDEQGLGSFTDDELGEAEETLAEEIRAQSEIDSDDALARMTELRDHVNSIREETGRREEAAEQRATDRAAILAEVNGETDPDAGDGEGDGDAGDADAGEETPAEGDGDGDGDGETPAETDGDGDGEETPAETPADPPAEQPQAQAAAAARPARPRLGGAGRRTPRRQAPQPREAARGPALVAAAGIPGLNPGTNFDDFAAVAAAMIGRHEAYRGPATSYEQIPVVTIRSEYPAERRLHPNTPEQNAALIAAVQEEIMRADDAITAAGGLCAPTTVRYDQLNISTADRPVRDSLAQFQAARGGLRFPTPTSFTDFTDAVNDWTLANDVAAATDPEVRKECFRVECNEWEEVFVEAIVKCLTFGNLVARTNNEAVQDAIEKTMAWWARHAERKLLTKIGADSTQVTDAGATLGAARHLLTVADKAVAGIRSRHRTRPDFPVRAIMPHWVKALIRADLAAELPGSSQERLATAEAQINAFFTARNVNITWALDGVAGQEIGAQGAGQLLDFPDEVIMYVFPEGSHLYLDLGELDLGIVRDSELNAANDYQMFSENWENSAFVGTESLEITVPVCANGGTAAAVDYDPCAAS